jgi:hypothetical protein
MSEKASTIVFGVDQTSQWGLIVPGKDVKSWVWAYFMLYDSNIHPDKKGYAHCTTCEKV